MFSSTELVNSIVRLMPTTKLIYLFGSQADGSATSHSDIDVAVLLPNKLDPIQRFESQQQLSIIFNLDVDLVDLLAASTVLQNQIVMTGQCIFGDENAKCAFEMQVLSMYQRLNEERQDILSDFIK